MKAVIIDNKIRLVKESDLLNVNIICPARNIQKMINETGCRIISKTDAFLNYKNNAGKVFELNIQVKFSNIEKYLKVETIWNCENKASYIEMLGVKSVGNIPYHDSNLPSNFVNSLYAFGNCSYLGVPSFCTEYYPLTNGKVKVIYLNDTQHTDFGKKRYMKNAGTWYSNKKY